MLHGSLTIELTFAAFFSKVQINIGDTYAITLWMMNVASIQGAHTGHLEVLYNAIDKWGQFWLYFCFFLLVKMHVKEYLVKEESSLWDSSLILYHWAEEDSIMSHIHSSILFTYLTLSTLLILSAYRPLVKDSKDIKSSGKDIKNAIILLNF